MWCRGQVGPQMFTIVANDIGAKLKKSTLIQFADDAKLVGKANNAAECANIQADLQMIGDWSNANLLPLSLLKCVSLHYGVHNEGYNYSVNGDAIKSVDKYADLGVIWAVDFKYNQHIASLCLIATRLVAMIFRLFSCRKREFLLALYMTFVQLVLEYASSIWSRKVSL